MTNKKITLFISCFLIMSILLVGCGGKNETQPSKDNANVTVSNVDQLIESIKPNSVINLESGVYNFSEASTYGKNTLNTYCFWDKLYDDEYQLIIRGIDNFTLTGDNSSIVTEPRTSQVITFEQSNNVVLKNLSIGHTQQAQACEGGVVDFDSCSDVTVDTCSLYGCGTVGIQCYLSNKVNIINSEIYHCSASGIDFYSGTWLTADCCKIYDCGYDERGFSIFNISDAKDVCISNCNIHDNNTEYFICGYEINDVKFESVNINNNRFNYMFDCGGELQFNNSIVNSNVVNTWFNTYSGNNSTVSIDGKKCWEEDLNSLYPKQIASVGVGYKEVQESEINYQGTKEVHVKTADEFLNAISSDITIFIDAEKIDLSTASSYGKTDDSLDYYSIVNDKLLENSTYYWASRYDGYGLVIGNVENLHIVGGEIITQPRYADVLTFYNCKGLTLDKVKLGHSPEEGACSGGVVYLMNCDDTIINDSDLYGCGILGIQTDMVSNLKVQNTLIHDCSYGAGYLYNSREIAFINCKIENCPSPHFALSNCEEFSWNNKLMDSNSSFDVN